VTTDPDFIVAIVEIIKDFGAKVILGDSPAFSTVPDILKKIGIHDKLSNLGVRIIEFNRPINKYKSHSFDYAIQEYDKMINIPKLKVHCQLWLSLSVKNLFGCVTGKRKPLLHLVHGDKKNHFAEMLVKNYDKLKPCFTIIDAVDVMEKEGPRGGIPKRVGLIFSGIDCVAIDRVASKVVGLDFEKHPVLKAARDLNVGEWRLEKIKIKGMNNIPSVNIDFPYMLPISFSPYRVIKSTIKNMLIKRRQRKVLT
ncbi:MAG: DUF362 domain-containing protein, partial [Spirochaetota bacterium]|nr:DUF362 domain-containing protein [Spirochaetota bacterium]